MRKLLILACLLCFLTINVCAEDLMTQQAEAYGVEKLEDELPEEVERILEDTELHAAAGFLSGLQDMLTEAFETSETVIRSSFRSMLRILCVAILCRTISCADASHLDFAVSAAGTMAVTLCCVTDLRNLIGLGISCMDELVSFSGILMPVMAAAAAGSGAVTGATAMQSISVLFFHLLIRISNGVLLPMVYGGLTLSVIDSLMQGGKLKGLRDLIHWVIKTCLKYMTYAFLGIVSLSGMVTGAADAAALHAAKAAISMAVPVVGGMVSGVADTVLSNASLLKSSIGIYGVLALLGIFIFPFIKMGISYLVFRLTAALCAVVEPKLCGLLEAISKSMGYFMAMVGCGVMMSVLSCFSLMRISHI